ncbi:GNAT family N-acetyltransferase [Paenibacillus sonchi]|uniref:GNAT family N-acetyltransferase n=1 Tax=Paenibacillus sonchi TaxID=373687 RepID=A0A974SCX8_9BACL|nr:GNAT family N-acetyltransferase [Paenibacillus sonchi]MCE3200968.1 GNAT family N-acetyltransferase [Paenibacillus sonchi]QQZ59725.1 GNAT family N-acetyltransferase [Paenibacillus sonchi]
MEIQKVHKEAVWQLRHEVMWPERELDYVKLDDDDDGVHYGLFDGERLVSAVSLFIDGKEAQFRKFATRTEQQGQGYGSRLLQHVLDEAERTGVNRIYCNARSYKAAFYKKFGLAEVPGTAFTKGGKEYIIMEKHFGSAGDRNRKEP